MSYDECPIFKATRNHPLPSGEVNECKFCAFYNNCLEDMGNDMVEEMLTIAGKYTKEMKDAVNEYISKESKEAKVPLVIKR